MTPWRGAGVAVAVLVAAVTVCGRLSRSGATRRAARFSSHSEASSPDDIEAFWTDERIDEATATMPTVDARYAATGSPAVAADLSRGADVQDISRCRASASHG